jgi:ankyrin repeat protein
LVSKGARSSDRPASVALLKAAATDDVDKVRSELARGMSPDSASKDGYTLLHLAARAGSMRVLRLLIERGANPNLTTGHGSFTPLHLAAATGRLEAARALLRAGADVRAKTHDGSTPEDFAAGSGHAALAKLLHDAARP